LLVATTGFLHTGTSLKTAIWPLLQHVGHVRPEHLVPGHEEGLREVEPGATQLVVHAWCSRRKGGTSSTAASRCSGRRRPSRCQWRRRTWRCDDDSQQAADGVEHEALSGVAVECAVGVRHHEAVVPRVDVPVQEPVHVQITVPRVLPDVHHYPCHAKLSRYGHANKLWSVVEMAAAADEPLFLCPAHTK
jgi:hypothetical protein